MANTLTYYILSTILWENISKIQLQEAAQNKALIWCVTENERSNLPTKND